MCYFSCKEQKLPFLAVLTWFLILGEIEDGGLQVSSSATTHKIYLIL